MPRFILAALILASTLLFAAGARAELIRKESPHDVATTIDRLDAVLKKQGLTIFARVDHAAGAQKAGLDLRPTTLLIFGNPQVGTQLMQAEQTMGIALPLKALAWRDAGGKVWLAYENPADMAKARGLAPDHPVIGKVTGALDKLTDAALNP